MISHKSSLADLLTTHSSYWETNMKNKKKKTNPTFLNTSLLITNLLNLLVRLVESIQNWL